MKLLIVFSSLLLSLNSFADFRSDMTCTNNAPQGNDSSIVVKFNNGAMDAAIHERSFSVSADKITMAADGNSLAVVGKKIDTSAEGVDSSFTLDALLIFNPLNNTMEFKVYANGFEDQRNGEVLDCQ